MNMKGDNTMYYNPYLYITVFLSIVLCYFGFKLSKIFSASKYSTIIGILLLILCVPGFLTISFEVIPFITHSFLIEYRSIEGIEVSTAVFPLLFGYIVFLKPKPDKIRWGILGKYVLLMSFIMVMSPYIFSLMFPVGLKYKLEERWVGDVCLQTSDATCVPAALASIFKYYGINKGEKEIAKAVYTSLLGTEDCYMVRYARKNGLTVEIYENMKAEELPVPSIITVKYNNIWHAVTVLGKKDNNLIIGDPLAGRTSYTYKGIVEEYKFNGEVYYFSRK